jgi:transcription antitermination factor NusG
LQLVGSMEEQQWHVIYSKPRNEKKVQAALEEAGFEVYCPLNKTRRKWSDRYKVVEEPLFRSYVFIKINGNQLYDILKFDGVVRFLYWNRKPAIVREEEIELIKRFLGEHESVRLESTEFQVDQAVTFTASNLMGQQGKVLEVRNKEVKVLIESMGYYLVATVDKDKLEPSRAKSI